MALTRQEIGYIEQRISPNRYLDGAVAKLFLASPDPKKVGKRVIPGSFLETFPSLSTQYWTDSGLYGGLALVGDPLSGVYTFQLYNLDTMMPCFQYELYYNLDYMQVESNLHAFEVDDCVIGFAFSDAQEATRLYQTVLQNIPYSSAKKANDAQKLKPKKTPGFKNILKNVKPANSTPIGLPTGIQQNNHMSLNPDGSLDIATVPKEWRMTLKQAGYKPKDLRDPKLVESILNIIEEEDMALTYREREPSLKNLKTDEILENYKLPERDEYRRYAMQEEEYEERRREYEEYQAQQKALEKWEQKHQPFVTNRQSEPQVSQLRTKTPLPVPPRKTERKGTGYNQFDDQNITQLQTSTPLPPVPQDGNKTNGNSMSPNNEYSDGNYRSNDERRISFMEPLGSSSRGRSPKTKEAKRDTSYDDGKYGANSPRENRAKTRMPEEKIAFGDEHKARRPKQNGGGPRRQKSPPPHGNPRVRREGSRAEGGRPRRNPSRGTPNEQRRRQGSNVPKTPRKRIQRDTDGVRNTPKQTQRNTPARELNQELSPQHFENEYIEEIEGIPPPPPPPPVRGPPAMIEAPKLPQISLQEQIKQNKHKLRPPSTVHDASAPIKSKKMPGGGLSFLQQIQRGDVKLKETGNWLHTTIKRVDKKLEKDPSEKASLIRKLQNAIIDRRDMLVNEDDDDDFDDDDWDIDED